MFSKQVCSFNGDNHSALKSNLMAIVGKKHPCKNREAKADKEDQEDKGELHCGHSNKKVILLSHFSRKQSSSAFQEPSHTKYHVYTLSLLPSSDDKIKTEDKSNISNYTSFKFNIHNLRCLPPSSHCIDGNQQDINNDVREAASRKQK